VREIPSLKKVDLDRVATYQSRIKKPLNGDRINKAVQNEKRVRLHTVGTQDSSTSFDDWLNITVKSILPKNKFEVFKQLVGEPVPTLTLSETIFDELAKIFESSNPSQKLTFESDNERKTNEFRNYFDLDRFFKEDVWEQLKLAPNSFIVVDVKDELTQGKPSPTPYFVNIEAVIDASVNRDGSTNYLIFRVDAKTVVAIDDLAYYVFDNVNDDYELREGYPSVHNLTDRLDRPYTPAFLIYPNFLNATDTIVVNSPLTKNLGAMEWLLFWAVSKRYLDLYAPFPIYVSYEEDCTYERAGMKCESGYLVSTSDDLEEAASTIPCPKCSEQRMFGAGTEVTVPAPQTKDEPNLIDAINVIPASKDSIEYVTAEKVRLEQEIYYSILGKTSQPLETFSQSVSQLDLSTESRKAVLLHVKSIFERVHNKVAYTMCKLMFGDEFIDSYVNYGDNYFLTTSEQETKNFKALKDAGAPEGMLHSNLERIIATTYKTVPYTALLNQIYLEVEPYQTMSIENVTKLVGVNMIPKKKALAKIHFTDFIEDFESEHYALVKMIQLGETDKDKAVKAIKAQLDKYVQTITTEIEADYKQQVEREEEQLEMQNKSKEMPDISKPSSVEKRSMPYRSGEDKD
jgi:predicted RNA-binding protein Jag